jgi:hypothetical protein
VKNKQILLFAAISIIFTLIYGSFIFTSNNIIIGNSPINDAYQTFEGVAQDLTIAHAGHLPTGVYWLPNFYGGSIATWFYVSDFPDITLSLFTFISAVTNNMIFALKIVEFITLFIAQFCSYKLAKYYFKRTWVAWILSLAYTFSSYYFNEVNDGHYNFIMAVALLPAVLLLFEKMLTSPTRKNMIFASFGAIVLFLTDIQTLIFTMFFIILRIGYYFVINYGKNLNTTIFKRLLELVALVGLFAAPFIFSFTTLQNTRALSVTPGVILSYWIARPSLFFLRQANFADPMILKFYLGISLLALSLVPIFMSGTKSKFNRKNYLFYWVTFAFFVLVAIGTPLMNLVTTFFVRVPDRAMSFVGFSLCMLAGYGLLCLSDFYNQRSERYVRFHWMKSKTFKTVLVVCLATIVFADMTIGLTPVTSPIIKLTAGDQFIQNQQGDFRLLTYPTTWASTNYESSLIGHEIIGESVMSLRSDPVNSALFTQLENYFVTISTDNYNKTSGIWNTNATKLCLLSTLCGAKYFLIEKNQTASTNLINFFNNSTKYFSLAFDSNESAVFENSYFEGMAFALKDNGNLPVLANFTVDDLSTFSLSALLKNITMEDLSKAILPDAQISCTQTFNKIQLSGNLSQPAYVVISQSYYSYWAVNNGDQTTFTNFLNLTAIETGRGAFNATATFSVGDQTQYLYIAFYIPLFLLCVLFYADWKNKKALFQVASSLLVVSGVALASLVIIQTSSSSSLNWTSFGPFSKLVIEFGALITAAGVLGFGKNIILDFGSRFPINNPKLLINNIKKLLTSRVNSSDSIYKLIKFLIVSLLLFIGIINLPLPQSDTVSWAEPAFAGVILSLIVLLYLMKNSLTDKKLGMAISVATTTHSSSEESKQNNDNIQHLHFGIFGGLAGVCVGGLLMRVLTSYTQSYVSLGLLLCTALGGLGFVALTSGNNRLRGIIGCFFAVIAIVFGLIMTYTTPIIIGYMQPTGTSAMYPLYQWHEYTFARFFAIQLFTADSLFFSSFGIAVAYLSASRVALKTALKRNLLIQKDDL